MNPSRSEKASLEWRCSSLAEFRRKIESQGARKIYRQRGAVAEVSKCLGSSKQGNDVAIESAGIVLVRSDPRDVVSAIKLSRVTHRATAYNLVAIPVAGGLFVHWGFDLPMSMGAVAMRLSTIIVALNAESLRGLKLQHETL
jgi:Cu2+-exporting ATPase